MPVTFRKQEAIHRLAEASAWMRLSETIEPRDARRAIRLVKQSLQDVGVDPETGNWMQRGRDWTVQDSAESQEIRESSCD